MSSSSSTASCPICFEKRKKTFYFQCAHWFCSECCVKCEKCPICDSSKITSTKARLLPSQQQQIKKEDPIPEKVIRKNPWQEVREEEDLKTEQQTTPSLWKKGEALNKGVRPSSDKKNYLDAVKMTKPVAASTLSSSYQPAQQQQQSKNSSKKKATKMLEFDLLAMAYQAEQQQKDRKQQQQQLPVIGFKKHHHQQQEESKKNDILIMRERINKKNQQKKKKKTRLTSLKKSILQERRARWWLLHPESKPFPLQSHPALIQHDCVWLGDEVEEDDNKNCKQDNDNNNNNQLVVERCIPPQSDDLNHDFTKKNDNNTSDEKGNNNNESSLEIAVIKQRKESLSSSTSSDFEEEEEMFSDEEEEIDSNDEEEETDDGNITDDTDDDDDDNKGKIISTPSFDSSIISPVFLGASYKLHEPSKMTKEEEEEAKEQQQLSNDDETEGKTTNKTKKKKKSNDTIKPLPPSRPYRDYVTQGLSRELDEIVLKMIETLFRFQERIRLEDPIKAKLRRRLVMGLREVRRGIKSKKCIAIIVAANIEEVMKLDERIHEIITLSTTPPKEEIYLWQPIPIIFITSKQKLGKSLGKKVPVSCIGIYSADGAHELFKQAIGLAKKLEDFWREQTLKEKKSNKRPICFQCKKLVLDIARRMCLNCTNTFCESCTSSREAKKVPCPEKEEEENGCNIVRIARTLPVIHLSSQAPAFVPSWAM